MQLCQRCLFQLASNLPPNEIYVLHELEEVNTPQFGLSRAEIYEKLNKQLSVFQLGQALIRLELLGFVKSVRFSKTVYSITDLGLNALAVLASK